MRSATAPVARERLLVSPAPAAEIAAAAYHAQQLAGLEQADFVVIAVEPGQLNEADDAINAALGAIA